MNEQINAIINELNQIDATKVISAIEMAPYCANTNLDLYIKIDGDLPDSIVSYVAEYNFIHKKENDIYLIIDFIGPDEAKGIPVWQRG